MTIRFVYFFLLLHSFLKRGKRLAIFINKEEVQNLASLLTENRPKTETSAPTLVMEHDRRGGTEPPWQPTQDTQASEARSRRG
jgi:hypothetical protein